MNVILKGGVYSANDGGQFYVAPGTKVDVKLATLHSAVGGGDSVSLRVAARGLRVQPAGSGSDEESFETDVEAASQIVQDVAQAAPEA